MSAEMRQRPEMLQSLDQTVGSQLSSIHSVRELVRASYRGERLCLCLSLACLCVAVFGCSLLF